MFKKVKKAIIYKILTSLFIQGLALIIPIYWSKIINNLSLGLFNKCYYLIVVIVFLTIFYYAWSFFNQKSWYLLYNSLYIEYNKRLSEEKINKLSLGGYTNVINNDVDIICTFFCNIITRVFQVIEFIIIYIYFLTLNFNIFLITFIISMLMILVLVMSSKGIEERNKKRKSDLDDKTIMSHEVYATLKKNNRDKNIYKSFFTSTNKYLKANRDFNIFIQLVINFILIVIEVTQYGLIFYSVYLMSIGNIELGTITLIYSYYAKIIANFNVLVNINADYQSFRVSLSRLNEILV